LGLRGVSYIRVARFWLKEISAEGSVSIELQVELNELVSEVKKSFEQDEIKSTV